MEIGLPVRLPETLIGRAHGSLREDSVIFKEKMVALGFGGDIIGP